MIPFHGIRLPIFASVLYVQLAPAAGYRYWGPLKDPNWGPEPTDVPLYSDSVVDPDTNQGRAMPHLTLDDLIQRSPHADYERIYKLERDMTGQIWLQATYNAGRSVYPGTRENARNFPYSLLVRLADRYLFDVVADSTDLSDRTFLVYILNFYDRRHESAEGQLDIMAEGPFKIQAAHDSDEIVMIERVERPPPWIFEVLGRSLRTFEVVTKGQAVFHIPAYTFGLAWLRGGVVIRPLSPILTSGRQWYIDSWPDPNSSRAFLVRIWCQGDPNAVNPRFRTEDFITNGPWMVLPAHLDDYFERIDTRQPPWPAITNQFARQGLPVPQFHDFVVRSPFEEEALGYERVAVDSEVAAQREREAASPESLFNAFFFGNWSRFLAHRYEMQCTDTDIRYYVEPPIGYSKESFIAKGVVTTRPVDAIDGSLQLQDDPSTLVPDSIEVRLQGPGVDRVIAQTVHTDHLPFQFEGKRESLATVFASLIFCVFSSGNDYNVNTSPYRR